MYKIVLRFFVFSLYLYSLLSPVAVFADADAPNIVIILADDMGWNDVGYHGSEIRTPHIDQLAADGLQLDRFYAQSTCTPTRAALMTGKSPQSLGIYSPLSKLNPKGLPPTEKLMPEYLREVGYQSFLVGKWHLGFRESAYQPLARGFDHFYGHLTGGIGYWDHVHGGGLDWQRNGKTLREDGYSTHLMTAEIDRLIKLRDRSKPMFLYAAFNAPHLPNEAPEETIAQYESIANPNRRIHAAMVGELDAAIGALIKTLDEQGMLENTLIWFMSDNGGLNSSAMPAPMVRVSGILQNWLGAPLPITFLEFMRTNTLDSASDNSPYRKGKQSIYEGGVRVPSFLYWKGKFKPGLNTQMITVQDVLPTILSAAGIQVLSPQSNLQGVDQWLNLTAGIVSKPRDYLVNGFDGEALYRFPWKLLALSSGEFELYRLDKDPEEFTDVSENHPDIVAELQLALEAYPRRESIHIPVWRAAMDMDFFGGKEDRIPWSEIEYQ
ncbi:arylsulfatase B [Oceanicoccus sagamiensis]|uniref:Sulfatase N-terminal domain-containing protein n=1 Tax=Oceanicoccus sagamiensis TaxID=716816 RepID=A0A1X9NKS3_9GAMM|nr:arylsulfatase [Oceanicoccus sagamiensis]ARN74553.1 hypothetical protein BST96_10725 [Oceanicoccus sagamiensis]